VYILGVWETVGEIPPLTSDQKVGGSSPSEGTTETHTVMPPGRVPTDSCNSLPLWLAPVTTLTARRSRWEHSWTQRKLSHSLACALP
jgi:hypothetical protein